MSPIEGIEHLILEMMVEMEDLLTNLNSQTGLFTVYTKQQVAAEFFLTCGHIEWNDLYYFTLPKKGARCLGSRKIQSGREIFWLINWWRLWKRLCNSSRLQDCELLRCRLEVYFTEYVSNGNGVSTKIQIRAEHKFHIRLCTSPKKIVHSRDRYI